MSEAIRKTLVSALILASLFLSTVTLAAGQLSLFQTEQAAQQHCPKDTVVWLNLPTGVYHFQGQRWYGRTKNGAYACEKEADQAGDRATRNGQ